ncbi:hypothetical protein AS034_21115 [[Bacillus] enclensis]|uniref:Uncharacterized protein n=2 Tax=[Bacillus] enclensis TaxID=1402860 RepID=A0A0V8H506_9BACI|nr:hypothetical protein AS034_21115 [[Bacillus] enclensis]SCC37021.1 hypothetical protein GA0061094_4374 [[Bacillus] enclensis]
MYKSKGRKVLAMLAVIFLLSLNIVPFLTPANATEGFYLDIKGFNLDQEGFNLEVIGYDLEVEPFSLEGRVSETDPWANIGKTPILAPVGPVKPIELPNGVKLKPNGDGTFTPVQPENRPTIKKKPDFNNDLAIYINNNGDLMNRLEVRNIPGKPGVVTDDEPKVSWVDAMKFVTNDIGGTTANFAGDMTALSNAYSDSMNPAALDRTGWKNLASFKWNMTTGVYKMATKGTSLEWTGDVYDTGINSYTTADNAYKVAQVSYGKIQTALGRAPVVPNWKPISRLNIGVAAVGTVTSGIESLTKWNSAYNATSDSERNQLMGETIGSVGETLMNGSLLVAAAPIPGAQVIGAGMAVVGGAMWLGATAYKYRKQLSSFIRKSKVGEKILDSKPAKAIKEQGKKAWNWAKTTLFGG